MSYVRFWDILSEQERTALRQAGRRREFRAGDSIFSVCGGDSWTAVIMDGKCRVVAHRADGSGTYLALRQAGDIIGEMAAIAGGSRSATVTAVSRVEVHALTQAVFQRLLSAQPGLTTHLLRVMIERLREADRCQSDFAVSDLQIRLSRLILRLADAEGVPTPQGVELRGFTQLDLANWCGTSRESVQRHMKKLLVLGILEPHRMRQRLVVLDMPKLRDHALLLSS